MDSYGNELAEIVATLNRTARSSREGAEISVSSHSLDRLLSHAVRRGASDLLLIAGAGVTLRINGSLVSEGPVLTGEECHDLVVPLLSRKQHEALQHERAIDFCFAREFAGRFRANVHYQRGTLAASIRLLPGETPTLESLHLPTSLGQLAARRQGLILVTGPTGCGKSSTLAALIHLINTTQHGHIVTIEDPIEFVHANRSSVIEQIEVGQDSRGFGASVRSVLRQNPDVILVGEMRDAETIATVLTAAETGHLVLSTLHTNDASQTVSRILDSFPLHSQQQMRQQFSLALLAIVAQRLLPGVDGRRYPVLEILVATPAVRNMIRRGEDHQLYSRMMSARSEGMITMEQSLADMVRARRIAREVAFAHCYRPDELRGYLDP